MHAHAIFKFMILVDEYFCETLFSEMQQ